MKKIFVLILFIATLLNVSGQLKVTAPGVKWESNYQFSISNSFKVEFYDKKGKLMREMDYKTYYQAPGEHFDVILVNDGRGNRVETIFDKTNEVAIQIYNNPGVEPLHNATRYKYPAETELKRLDLTPTDEYKEILGHRCQKHTYVYKKITGECWITGEISLSNDYGIFRAAKMASLHNTLSVGGFAMEMTSFDSSGAKTVMKTVSLANPDQYSISLESADMKTALNRVNYFSF